MCSVSGAKAQWGFDRRSETIGEEDSSRDLGRVERVRRRSVVAAIVVVLVAIAAPGVGAATRADPQMWRRVDLRRAGFGARGVPDEIIAGGPGFIATGHERRGRRWGAR